MGKLHDKMIEDLQLRGYSPKTCKEYVRCARAFVWRAAPEPPTGPSFTKWRWRGRIPEPSSTWRDVVTAGPSSIWERISAASACCARRSIPTWARIPAIAMEIHEDLALDMRRDEILEQLASRGYRAQSDRMGSWFLTRTVDRFTRETD